MSVGETAGGLNALAKNAKAPHKARLSFGQIGNPVKTGVAVTRSHPGQEEEPQAAVTLTAAGPF